MIVEELRIAKDFVDQKTKSISLIELLQGHSARNDIAYENINQ